MKCRHCSESDSDDWFLQDIASMRPLANLASRASEEGGDTVHDSILGSQVAPAANLLKLEDKELFLLLQNYTAILVTPTAYCILLAEIVLREAFQIFFLFLYILLNLNWPLHYFPSSKY